MKTLTRAALRSHTPSRAEMAFRALYVLTGICLLLQVLIDSAYANIFCSIIVAISASATFAYVRTTRALESHPLSTLTLVGLCVTTQWGALVVQSMSWASLTDTLRVPAMTFGNLAAFQFIALAAHWTIRNFSMFTRIRVFVGDQVLVPIGIFSVPAVATTWALGLIGLGSLFLAGSGENDLSGKVAGGLSFLAWAPFTIPLLHQRYGSEYANLRVHWPALIGYMGAVIIVGLALNFRQVMFFGVLTAVLLLTLEIFSDERPFEWRWVRPIALVALIVGALISPLNYFLTAVQVAREYRGKVGPIEMIQETYRAVLNPVAVEKERDAARVKAILGLYDEYYFGSQMIGRLIETKFHDNSFYMVQGIRSFESEMLRDDAGERMLALLPYPVLKWFGLQQAKLANSSSIGDYLYYLRYGQADGFNLGEFKTGSVFAQGVGAFGIWFYIIYFWICLAVFTAWDILSMRVLGTRKAVVSILGMLLIYRLFAYGIVSESLSGLVGLLVRNQIQSTVLFALVAGGVGLFLRPFKTPKNMAKTLGTPVSGAVKSGRAGRRAAA